MRFGRECVAAQGGQVLVAFDTDGAGEKMAWRVAEAVPQLLGLGLSVAQVAGSLGLSVEQVQAVQDSL
jgi:predicted transposase YdaD